MKQLQSAAVKGLAVTILALGAALLGAQLRWGELADNWFTDALVIGALFFAGFTCGFWWQERRR